jgi:hypothetical protein
MRGGVAVVESRRGEVQSGRYRSGDDVKLSGRPGLLEGGVSLIGVRWRYESETDVVALMAATGERHERGAAGADGSKAGASVHSAGASIGRSGAWVSEWHAGEL